MTFGFSDSKTATRESVRLLIAEAAKACADMFSRWASELESVLTGRDVQTPKTPEGPEELKGPWNALAMGKGPGPSGTEATRGRGRGRGASRVARGAKV
jgi:hypothetical protein